MALYYKSILRSENYRFDFSQNRDNSRHAHIIAFNRKNESDWLDVATIDNKKKNYEFKLKAIEKFKPETIDKLRSYLRYLNG